MKTCIKPNCSTKYFSFCYSPYTYGGIVSEGPPKDKFFYGIGNSNKIYITKYKIYSTTPLDPSWIKCF